MPLSKVLNPPRRTALARLSGVALAALGGAALSACDQLGQATGQQPSFRGIDITGAPYGRDFRLTDVDGQERTLADYRGKLVLLYFGFVQCPDVCPTALTRAVETKRLLGPDGDQLQVIFVTVDPERDTPELLAQYVPAFDARFLGLYGTPEKIAEVAKEFRVFYRKSGDLAGHYTIDHTAGTYVFGPDGRPRLYVKHAEDPQVVVADIKALLAGK